MVGKQDKTPQLGIFDTPLESFTNLNHELCILSKKIDWDSIEEDFSFYYSEIGRPSVPIRRMIGLLLLKYIYNLSDEAIVDRWIENPYWQYFSGELVFQTDKPFDPTEFIQFRNRIGKEGATQSLKTLSMCCENIVLAELRSTLHKTHSIELKNKLRPLQGKIL